VAFYWFKLSLINVTQDNMQRKILSSSSRRNFIRTAGAGAAGVSLAGCIGGGGGGEGITIGFLGPLQLDVGVGGERSAQIAVDRINENGGILDQEVELVSADSGANPSDAQTEVQSLISDENIDFLAGVYVSEVALGIIDRVAEANVPWMVCGAGTPRVTTEHVAQDYERYKNVFRVMSGNSDLQAENQARYIEFLSEQHGWDSFAIIPENAAWTEPTSELLPGFLEERGIEVALHERIEVDTTDFTPILDSVEESGADAIFKQFALVDGAGMLQTWGANEYPFAQEGLSIPALGVEYWDDTNGNCLYESSGWFGGCGAVNVTDNTESFLDEYQERHDSRPRIPVIMGLGTYDAINIYKNGVEEAGTADFNNDLDGIVEALEQTDHTGVSGQIQFHLDRY
jgi:branched-chain amino acid transport system substrate-binding protein